MRNRLYLSFFSIGLLLTSTSIVAQSQLQWGPDGVITIEEGSGGFDANLDPADRFSRDHDVIGDVNGDGILDLIVGARSDDDGAIDAGAAYILFMNTDGTVQFNQKISMLEGNFTETLLEGNFFGYGVAGIGDYDTDGIPDVAISAPVPPNRAIYVIHLNADGTVKDFVKNSNITAQGLSAIGDLNNDGRIDIVACDPGSDLGGTDIGAIRILFFNANSQIMPAQTVLINPETVDFGQALLPGDQFGGREVAMLGDIDNDGTLELAVGAFMSDGGKGAIWMLSLNEQFQVVSKLKIAEGLNGFSDTLTVGVNPNGTEGANLGHALCKVGDLNGDGVNDLMTGANQQNEGWGYILYLNADKTVKTYTRINNTEGGFDLILEPEERFSRSISYLGDLRGDGTIAVNYGGGAGNTGTLYLLFFKPCTFSQILEGNKLEGGNTLFSNWDEASAMLVSNALSFEQCTFKSFENNAAFVEYDSAFGKCICKDFSAVTILSEDNSIVYTNECYSGELTSMQSNTINKILIYPNPAENNMTIDLSSFHKSNFPSEISIFNIEGKCVYNCQIISSKSNLNIANLSTGLYLINVRNKSSNNFMKFFKID